jgi:hypothetical protein
MDYLQEWKASCVDEELTRLNVVALNGLSPAEYLLYSDGISRRNDGRISENFLQRYTHLADGGWWCSGINILTGEEDVWGCFKPNSPRRDSDREKVIKYEHPPKTATSVFALKTPIHIWQRISDRYKLDIAEDIDSSLPDLGFWRWLCQHPQIPLCITEGAKKTGALLSAGFAAIGLPGINNGYRTSKDELGNRISEEGSCIVRQSCLIPSLKKLAVPNREVYLVFDRDSKPNTVKAVNAAIKKTGYLLQQAGCQVKVVSWDCQWGKGVDDFIARKGITYFESVYENAVSLETWKANQGRKLTYDCQEVINCRYLPGLIIPDREKLIGLKSAKGTGKTKLLESVVSNALAKKQKVLVIGHRIQLVKALCLRFGLPYVTEVREDNNGKLGYGLCIDSLHPHSLARFNPDDWLNSLVIIDEVEQVLWHGLNSSTCRDRRVEILQCLKGLLQNVLGSQGQVYIADADLSDLAFDYLISLADTCLQPYIIANEWQREGDTAWDIYHYAGKTPKKLVKDLETHLREGGKPLVCLSAQKIGSKWGTQTLEAYFKAKFPDYKILRLDSESLVDPHHPAYDCITNLDRILRNYDLVLASPCLETGISIELQNHFTSVWAIAQGIQSDNAVRQTLARLRCNVPRYLWCASYSFQKIGNGSTSIPSLITSGHNLTQLNIRLLQQSDLANWDEVDTSFQAESLLCWAKMAVRYNASTINYRESILAALKEEGHTILDSSEVKNLAVNTIIESSSLVDVISEIRQANYDTECQAIAGSALLTEKQYQTLKKRVVKTITERHSIRKYELQQRYHLPVTSTLVTLDNAGWYQKIRLHYFLTIGRRFLADRDTKVAQKLIAQGNGSLFFPDFNSSQLGVIVGIMELLGITILLGDLERELCNTDSDLQALAKIALSHRQEIKTAMGIGLAVTYSPIMIIKRFLEKIDCQLSYLRSKSCNQTKKRLRIYQIVIPEDGRKQVFYNWIKQDCDLTKNEIICDRFIDPLLWNEYQSSFKELNLIQNNNADYLQLSLNL